MMRKSNIALFVSAAVLSVAALPAFAQVAPVNATYTANYMGMSATGKMTVASIGGGKYRTMLSVNNKLGFSNQVTVFDEQGGNLRPLSSVDNSRFMGKNIESKATYDWGSGIATWDGANVSDDKKGPARMSAGDMDALLVNLAIVRDVNAGRPMNYRLLENGKASTMRYTVAGKETLTIGGKQVTATKVVSNASKPVTLWVAPGYSVPVRIEKQVDMGKMRLTLSSID